MYKVLFIAHKFQTGGATKSLFYLSKNLRDKYQIHPIILVNSKGILTDMCDAENIQYIILNYKDFAITEGSTKLKRILKKILFPVLKTRYIICNKIALKRIDKLIDMNSISIIHTNVNRDDFGALLSKKYNIPHVWHLREFGDIDYKCIYLKKNYINYMNENTDYFVAISNAVRKYFINKGLHKNKIKLVYNGIKLEKNYNKKFSKDKLKILFMGALQDSKGQIELIEAINLLPKNISKNILIDFYGDGSSKYIKYLKEKIKDYKLKNIFKFKGYSKNIENIIKNYDIGIMCSTSEAFGRVIVEYMTNKLITIASNTGACPEIITKDSGFIYEHGNYQDLANIITKIYNMNEKEKTKLVNEGYKRAKDFSLEKHTENIMNLYNEIIKKKG